MQRRRLERLIVPARVVATAATASLCALLVLEACASRSNPVGPGGECFLATDCAPGLVCVEQSSGARICSDDLSRVAGEPPEGEEQDASADAPVGADTSTPDTSTPPPDTGGPPPDTGGPPPDTGGPPPDDSGTDT